MRRRISVHIRWSRFLFVAIGLGLLFGILHSLTQDKINQESAIVMLVFLIICGLLYFLIDQAKIVEYDNEFMYVTGKVGEEKIALRDVYKVKMTMNKINNRSMWKIGYYDQRRAEKAVRILPRWIHNHFDEFKSLVQVANKNVKIQNWSHSFDFDQ